jgi:hypothetical protein
MTYESDNAKFEKLALAIMAQTRAAVQPRKKNWGNPAPLFVTTQAANHLNPILTYAWLGRWLVLS